MLFADHVLLQHVVGPENQTNVAVMKMGSGARHVSSDSSFVICQLEYPREVV